MCRVLLSSGVAVALLLIINGSAETAAWKDPSTHLIRFVEVEPGVKLEVLDWGGSGEPLLLLAGHGDTGHVFDDFAPRLTGDFHVFALTRRGFGASSQPESGYDLARMVQDILQVLDALRLRRIYLAGHSIAGDELTRFALSHPDRVSKLVYLEAAYDRVETQHVESTFPRLRPAPKPTPSDVASPKAFRSYLGRTEILMPESEIRATRVFGPDGQYLRLGTPDAILASVARIVEHPDYAAIQARMLAIYAVYTNPAQLLPRYTTADPEARRGIEMIFGIWQTAAKAERDRFRLSAPLARVHEIAGARHDLFISNRDEVLRDMRSFLRN